MLNVMQPDQLSAPARWILKLNAESAYTRLVVDDRAGDDLARPALEAATPTDLLASPVVDPKQAEAMLAALWLWHDWLDESHVISQKIETPTGSFWHAIMHRREGDFPNSKYWYARCADHPALPTIGAHAGAILNPQPADKRLLKLTLGGWNANAWVDLVEQLEDKPNDPLHRVAVALQQLEWRVLFDSCTRAAAGK